MQELHAEIIQESGDEAGASCIRKKKCIAQGSLDPHTYVNEAKYLEKTSNADEAIIVLEGALSQGVHDDYVIAVLAKFYDEKNDGG
jgi:predicted Zn-dependent protease